MLVGDATRGEFFSSIDEEIESFSRSSKLTLKLDDGFSFRYDIKTFLAAGEAAQAPDYPIGFAAVAACEFVHLLVGVHVALVVVEEAAAAAAGNAVVVIGGMNKGRRFVGEMSPIGI